MKGFQKSEILNPFFHHHHYNYKISGLHMILTCFSLVISEWNYFIKMWTGSDDSVLWWSIYDSISSSAWSWAEPESAQFWEPDVVKHLHLCGIHFMFSSFRLLQDKSNSISEVFGPQLAVQFEYLCCNSELFSFIKSLIWFLFSDNYLRYTWNRSILFFLMCKTVVIWLKCILIGREISLEWWFT